MTTYRHSKELKGNTLELGDTLKFTKGANKGSFKVTATFLDNTISIGNNHVPLDMIGLTSERERRDFCTKNYGYSAGKGSWPIYSNNDMDAITRTVIVIFLILEKGFSWRYRYE